MIEDIMINAIRVAEIPKEAIATHIGILSSRSDKSLENLVRILPTGFESKNSISDLICIHDLILI